MPGRGEPREKSHRTSGPGETGITRVPLNFAPLRPVFDHGGRNSAPGSWSRTDEVARMRTDR
ncbi:hypothetical protein SBD_2832 [Streptomyces bottropensis ATCC 25435]|uniref:Uncharacterized protein n=1 Tax=Streptomyces bottropensis ATCC 25435 TaxID=1054862 RepID=M3FRB8_9ACTN|nr:hypothetical protein SBD_2832 [Streptomyces bottropensis ATCC 25435]